MFHFLIAKIIAETKNIYLTFLFTSFMLFVGNCSAGFICFGGAEYPNPVLGLTWGRLCLPGFYCPDGTNQEIGCPEGTYL